MNLLDFLIFIPILYFCYRGIKNGLIGEILGIIGLILAVYLTFQYMDVVADWIQPLFDEDATYVVFVAGTIIFFCTLIVVQIIDFLSAKFLVTIRLHTINRILGAFFGLIKGGVIISAILLLLAGFNIPSENAREESATYSYVIYLAPWVYNAVATENFTRTIQNTFNKYEPVINFPIVNE